MIVSRLKFVVQSDDWLPVFLLCGRELLIFLGMGAGWSGIA